MDLLLTSGFISGPVINLLLYKWTSLVLGGLNNGPVVN